MKTPHSLICAIFAVVAGFGLIIPSLFADYYFHPPESSSTAPTVSVETNSMTETNLSTEDAISSFQEALSEEAHKMKQEIINNLFDYEKEYRDVGYQVTEGDLSRAEGMSEIQDIGQRATRYAISSRGDVSYAHTMSEELEDPSISEQLDAAFDFLQEEHDRVLYEVLYQDDGSDPNPLHPAYTDWSTG